MAAPGVGCMISAGRYALGLDPLAHRAPSGSGDASPHELSRREDDGSNHREPDKRAHRRERMRDCEHAIVEVAPGAGKLHRPGMGPGVARLAADEAEAAVSACEALRIPTLGALLRLVAAAAARIPCRLERHLAYHLTWPQPYVWRSLAMSLWRRSWRRFSTATRSGR